MREFPFDWAGVVRRIREARRRRGPGRWHEQKERLRSRLDQLAERPVVAELMDLSKMTVRALRELARKVVGSGHSALKTKDELIEAIRAALAGERAEGAGDASAWEEGPGAPAEAREPRPEGVFVARVRGEDEVRRAPHALTEDHLAEPEPESAALAELEQQVAAAAAPEYDEGLGELPPGYGDDAVVALPRDPETLWVYWDFAHPTIQDAMRGLENPHAKLRIFEHGRLVREYDFALESRSFYVHNLAPGRHYRAEIYFVGTNGAQQRVGSPSNTIGLPPRGPSSIVDDRFVTLPWGAPLARRHDLFAEAKAEALSDAGREELFAASAGRPLGASESARPGGGGAPDYHAGGGSSARSGAGTRHEGV